MSRPVSSWQQSSRQAWPPWNSLHLPEPPIIERREPPPCLPVPAAIASTRSAQPNVQHAASSASPGETGPSTAMLPPTSSAQTASRTLSPGSMPR